MTLSLKQQVSESEQRFSIMEEKQGFEYETIDAEIRIIVRQQTDSIKGLIRRSAQNMIDIGNCLLLVKETLKHGEFRSWLKTEFSWSLRTAARYMQVGLKFKSANLADLDIAASALYLLAEPSTPSQATEKILNLAKEGEKITHAKTKEVVDSLKKATLPVAITASLVNVSDESKCLMSPTFVETQRVTLVANPNSIVVSKSIDVQQFGETIEKIGNFLESNRESVTNSVLCIGSLQTEKQAEEKIQTSFAVGIPICITDFDKNDHFWVGEVAEIKNASGTTIEMLVKISLYPKE